MSLQKNISISNIKRQIWKISRYVLQHMASRMSEILFDTLAPTLLNKMADDRLAWNFWELQSMWQAAVFISIHNHSRVVIFWARSNHWLCRAEKKRVYDLVNVADGLTDRKTGSEPKRSCKKSEIQQLTYLNFLEMGRGKICFLFK